MTEAERAHKMARIAYDHVAWKYFRLFHDEMEQKEFDRRLIGSFCKGFPRDAVFCDAGCGPTALISRYLYRLGYQVFGIDLSEKCIEIARSNYPDIDFYLMDMANLSLADESVDGIIAFYSIIHTPKQVISQIFQECCRVIKDGGKLLVVVKEGEAEGYVSELLDEPVEIYLSEFREEEIAAYFTRSRFRLEYLSTRKAYDFEIEKARIYGIGRKEKARTY